MTSLADPPLLAADVAPDPLPAAERPALLPLSQVSVNLLPDEVRERRRLAYLKRRMVFVLIALIALVGLGDALARQQTAGAADGLAGANGQVATLNKQLGGFTTMLQTQGDTQAIWTQLDGVMGTNVIWSPLISRLRNAAPSGLRLNSIGTQVGASGSAGSTSTTTLPPVTGGTAPAGTLTLSGNAPSWQAVAQYVRALSHIRGVTGVNPATVSSGNSTTGGGKSGLTFSITASLTSDVLSNQYSATSPTSTATGGSGASGGSTTSTTPTGPATTTSTQSPTSAAAPPAAPASAHTRTIQRNASKSSAARRSTSKRDASTRDTTTHAADQHHSSAHGQQSSPMQQIEQPDHFAQGVS